ncbi:E3 ubiquitin-protein ligase XIAP-like isoform X1 [Cataglyphis hispanica]|uniref:E3 ubiquitin-protein ligase XIAP-like isoform X1 n=1 Tax=Cataglyphis hispanica TaxID=1086592 RepID=UPI00217F4C3E|nr:E3 ubiquitin-protein ligase XIAP-like isoform X1 [Cataglyphis hispanica]
MNVEEKRLATFREWPSNAAIGASCLAKAGFYYTGRCLEVQCFLCGTMISDWNYGDQAMARHRRTAPNCPFVIDPAGTCNVPFIPTTASVALESTNTTSSNTRRSDSDEGPEQLLSSVTPWLSNPLTLREYETVSQRLQTFDNWPLSSIIRPEQLAAAGFYYLQYKDLVECAFCKGILMNWKAGDDPEHAHKLNFPNCDFYMRQTEDDDAFGLVRVLSGTSTNLTELGIQMHTVSISQYTTYEKRLQTFQNWPKNLKQTPEMLAAAGFYYQGYDDQVRCFHCDGGLHGWQPTDDVWIEHAYWFPNCGFVILMRGHKFIKHSIDTRGSLNLSIFADVTGENDAIETSATLPRVQLNEALTDTTMSVTDVLKITSVTSSTSVSQSSEPITDTVTQPMAGATDTIVTSVPTVLPSNKSITDVTVKRLLDTAPVKAALEIGLHVDRVTKALKRRMEEVGEPYVNVTQLIEAVLHDQLMEDHTRFDNNTPTSSSLELKTLFNQIMQSASNSTSKTQVSNTAENKHDKKETDNESDDIMSLREETRKLKEARLCKICMDNELAIVFLPCGHLATCDNCTPALTTCPLCRLKIRAYIFTRRYFLVEIEVILTRKHLGQFWK